ncbi:hypothetical protein IWX47DRAFT_875862 [Phyllosticta citricarpa]
MDGQAGKLDLRWMYRDFFSFLFFSFYSWLLKSKRLFSLLPFLTCSSLLLVVVGCFLPLVHLIPNRQTDRQTDRRATAVAGLGYIVSSTSLHTYIHTHTPPYVNVCCLHIYLTRYPPGTHARTHASFHLIQHGAYLTSRREEKLSFDTRAGGDSKKIRGYFSLYSSVDIDVVDWEKKHGKRLRWLSSRSEPR